MGVCPAALLERPLLLSPSPLQVAMRAKRRKASVDPRTRTLEKRWYRDLLIHALLTIVHVFRACTSSANRSMISSTSSGGNDGNGGDEDMAVDGQEHSSQEKIAGLRFL